MLKLGLVGHITFIKRKDHFPMYNFNDSQVIGYGNPFLVPVGCQLSSSRTPC